MQRLLTFRNILILLTSVFFAGGGYLGYLGALVDQDEILYLQRVEAVSDKSRLEQQLARAQSILDARRRAYLRKSLEFISEQKALLLRDDEDQIPEPVKQIPELTSESIAAVQRTLDEFKPETFAQPIQQQLLALQEEQADLQFFEDEVDTLEQLLDREFPEDNQQAVFAGDQQRRRVSDALVRLLQLLDKQRELAEERRVALEQLSYWERNPKGSPTGVDITVYNKGAGSKTLEPVHVTQISTALSIMPADFDGRLERLYIVYGDPEMRRGMSGLGVVFMKGEESDFFRVLVHEFGHIYDLYREVASGVKSAFYDGQYRLFQEDPSVTFYEYSWASNAQRVAELSAFASSYGTSDPFEDFAEAFALYVLQHETFTNWSFEDQVLAQKFQFLKDAFNGRSFPSTEEYLTRPYDVTMLNVDYDELLDLAL